MKFLDLRVLSADYPICVAVQWVDQDAFDTWRPVQLPTLVFSFRRSQ